MTVALLIQKESVEFVVFIFIEATIAIGFNKNDMLWWMNICKIKLHFTNLQTVLCGLNNLTLQCATTIFICRKL